METELQKRMADVPSHRVDPPHVAMHVGTTTVVLLSPNPPLLLIGNIPLSSRYGPPVLTPRSGPIQNKAPIHASQDERDDQDARKPKVESPLFQAFNPQRDPHVRTAKSSPTEDYNKADVVRDEISRPLAISAPKELRGGANYNIGKQIGTLSLYGHAMRHGAGEYVGIWRI